MDEGAVVLLSLGVAVLLVAVIGGGLWCRKHCCSARSRQHDAYHGLMDDDADYDFDVDPDAVRVSHAADARHFSINTHAQHRDSNHKGTGTGTTSLALTGGAIQSSRMWLGGANPTDHRDAPADPTKAARLLSARLARLEHARLERAADATLRVANFCRSIGTHTRTLVQALPDIGHGGTARKFCTLISDPFVSRAVHVLHGTTDGAGRPVVALMTMTTATLPSPSALSPTTGTGAGAVPLDAFSAKRAPAWPTLGTPQGQAAFKQLLLRVRHPCVASVFDVGFALAPAPPSVAGAVAGAAASSAGSGGAAAAAGASVSPIAAVTEASGAGSERWNVFVVREWLADSGGSVRDFLHSSRAPALQFRHKYCSAVPDPHTATYPANDAPRPLRLKYITQWGRHALLALAYLTRVQRVPCHGVLHSGNLLLRADGLVALTDWEVTLLGHAHKSHTALVTLQHHSTARGRAVAAARGLDATVVASVDPVVLAFAALVFELSSGYELAPHTLQRWTDPGAGHSEVYLFGLTKKYAAVDAVLHRIINRSLPPSATTAAASPAKAGKAAHRSDAKHAAAAVAANSIDPLAPVTLEQLLDMPLFGGTGKGLHTARGEDAKVLAAVGLGGPGATVGADGDSKAAATDPHATKALTAVWRYWDKQFAVTSSASSKRSKKPKSGSGSGSGSDVAVDILGGGGGDDDGDDTASRRSGSKRR